MDDIDRMISLFPSTKHILGLFLFTKLISLHIYKKIVDTLIYISFIIDMIRWII